MDRYELRINNGVYEPQKSEKGYWYKADEVDADKVKDTVRIQELEEEVIRLDSECAMHKTATEKAINRTLKVAMALKKIEGKLCGARNQRMAEIAAIATEALKEGEDGSR